MRIILLDVQTRKTAINKTMAGGYGTSSDFGGGNNIFVNILKRLKKNSVKIPLIELAYLSAIFKKQGYDVEIMYGNHINEADIYIIYGSLVEFKSEIKIAKEIRSQYPGAKIGFIGTFATVNPKQFSKYSDFVIAAEPDLFFNKLNDTKVEELEGIINGSNYFNDLDDLPFPDWTEFKMKEFAHIPLLGRHPVYPVLTSRGCPFSCKYYCAYPIYAGGKVRYRSIDKIIDELKYLETEHNSKAILFRDPTFTLNKKHASDICKAIIERNINIKWACETHPATLNKDLVDLMYDSGNRAITIGIESRSTEVIIQSKRKDTDDKHLKDIVDYCEKKGIKIMAGYIMGDLADSQESILNTIEYAKTLNTSFAQFTVSTPYPGTEYYQSVKNRILTKDWTKFDSYSLVFKHDNLSSRKISNLQRKAYTQYYFRTSWLTKKFLYRKINDLFDRS